MLCIPPVKERSSQRISACLWNIRSMRSFFSAQHEMEGTYFFDTVCQHIYQNGQLHWLQCSWPCGQSTQNRRRQPSGSLVCAPLPQRRRNHQTGHRGQKEMKLSKIITNHYPAGTWQMLCSHRVFLYSVLTSFTLTNRFLQWNAKRKNPETVTVSGFLPGEPGGIRTHDLLIRSWQ